MRHLPHLELEVAVEVVVGLRERLQEASVEEEVVGRMVLRLALAGVEEAEEQLGRPRSRHHRSLPLLVLVQVAEVVGLLDFPERGLMIWNHPLRLAGVEEPLFRRGCSPAAWHSPRQVGHLRHRKNWHRTQLRTTHLPPDEHVIYAPGNQLAQGRRRRTWHYLAAV